jgi:hypothetical protein
MRKDAHTTPTGTHKDTHEPQTRARIQACACTKPYGQSIACTHTVSTCPRALCAIACSSHTGRWSHLGPTQLHDAATTSSSRAQSWHAVLEDHTHEGEVARSDTVGRVGGMGHVGSQWQVELAGSHPHIAPRTAPQACAPAQHHRTYMCSCGSWATSTTSTPVAGRHPSASNGATLRDLQARQEPGPGMPAHATRHLWHTMCSQGQGATMGLRPWALKSQPLMAQCMGTMSGRAGVAATAPAGGAGGARAPPAPATAYAAPPPAPEPPPPPPAPPPPPEPPCVGLTLLLC